MLLQRFISAATTALVAIKPSPLLQRLRVSEFSTIMIVISVTTSTSCLLGDFDVPLRFLLLLIWVMLISDIDFFFFSEVSTGYHVMSLCHNSYKL